MREGTWEGLVSCGGGGGGGGECTYSSCESRNESSMAQMQISELTLRQYDPNAVGQPGQKAGKWNNAFVVTPGANEADSGQSRRTTRADYSHHA